MGPFAIAHCPPVNSDLAVPVLPASTHSTHPTRKTAIASIRRPAALATASISALLLAVAVDALWLEPASLRTQHAELAIPNWPNECAGLRVAALTDLHVGSPFNGIEKLERVVAETNLAAPDLILLAGDPGISAEEAHSCVLRRVLGSDFYEAAYGCDPGRVASE